MLAGVWLLYFSFGLSGFSLAPLVVPVTRDLGMSYGDMGWVLGAWQLVYIASAVPCGVLLDRLGPRRALLIGAALIAASGFLRAVAVDFPTLFLAVALFGLGGPIVSTGAPKVVALWFTGPSRGLAMGIYITGPAVAGIIVLVSTNGLLMPLFDGDWRWVLRLWAGLAVVTGLVWALITLHPAARAMERDLAAAPRRPQLEVLAGLLRLPPIRLVMAMSVGIFMFNHGLNNWLPELLRAGGMSPAAAGVWSALPTAVGIAGSLLIPRLATPERRFLVLAALAAGAVVATLCLHAAAGPVLAFGMVLQGIARSALMTVTVLTLVEMKGVGERNAGTASGLFFAAAEIGGVGGPVLLGVTYDLTGGFDAGLWMLTAVCLALLLAVGRLKVLAAR